VTPSEKHDADQMPEKKRQATCRTGGRLYYGRQITLLRNKPQKKALFFHDDLRVQGGCFTSLGYPVL